MHPLDAAVLVLAARQCGLFSRRQVLDRGGSDAIVLRRLRAGRWVVVAPGVYGVAGHELSFRRSVWAAYLAGPSKAVVSHWAAGSVRRLPGFPPNRLTLTVPHGTRRANPIARVFQTRSMPVGEPIGGLPVTSVERILLDVASVTGPRKLLHLVDAARAEGATSLPRLRREFLRLARSGRDGICTMRDVLGTYDEGPSVSRRQLESHLDRILGRIPAPVIREGPLPGREWSSERVDRRYEHPRKLVVEGDGRRWHTRVQDFARDRERDRTALRAGYPTVRYAYEELVDDPDAVEAELRDLLGLLEGSANGFRT
ncbi:MAG TPA: type IV toxin-antitoxin system AbiEi family antitoxin domain-containing protein [Acidimicrobiales bacterium]|nr:type IV toxin-antitoxin system AbiEi family antitoxin domain-containing protein [Acidimicrobiales bacterium]